MTKTSIHEELRVLEEANYRSLDEKRLTIDAFIVNKLDEQQKQIDEIEHQVMVMQARNDYKTGYTMDWDEFVKQNKPDEQEECENCGGKGYNTVLQQTTVESDFIGDKRYKSKPKIEKIPCRICQPTDKSLDWEDECLSGASWTQEGKKLHDKIQDLLDKQAHDNEIFVNTIIDAKNEKLDKQKTEIVKMVKQSLLHKEECQCDMCKLLQDLED